MTSRSGGGDSPAGADWCHAAAASTSFRNPTDDNDEDLGSICELYARRYRQLFTVEQVGRVTLGERTLADLDVSDDPYLRKFRSSTTLDLFNRLQQMPILVDEQTVQRQKQSPYYLKSSSSGTHQQQQRSESGLMTSTVSPAVGQSTGLVTGSTVVHQSRPSTSTVVDHHRTSTSSSSTSSSSSSISSSQQPVDEAQRLFDALLAAVEAARVPTDLSPAESRRLSLLGQRSGGLQLINSNWQLQNMQQGQYCSLSQTRQQQQPTTTAAPRRGSGRAMGLPAASSSVSGTAGGFGGRCDGLTFLLTINAATDSDRSRRPRSCTSRCFNGGARRSREQPPVDVTTAGHRVEFCRDIRGKLVGIPAGAAPVVSTCSSRRDDGLTTVLRNAHVMPSPPVLLTTRQLTGHPSQLQLKPAPAAPLNDFSVLVRLS
jgi:hypothetical protein